MTNKLAFRYDREGDVLYIDTCPAYTEQESTELTDEMVVRLNPDTGAVENVEVLFFSSRLLSDDLLELPVSADLRMIATVSDLQEKRAR